MYECVIKMHRVIYDPSQSLTLHRVKIDPGLSLCHVKNTSGQNIP